MNQEGVQIQTSSWIQETLRNAVEVESVLIINPTDEIVSDFIVPPSHQDSFPFQRFPKLTSIPFFSKNDPKGKRRSLVDPISSTSSNLANPTASLSSLKEENQSISEKPKERSDLSKSLPSLPQKHSEDFDSFQEYQSKTLSFETSSVFNKPLNFTKCCLLSTDQKLLEKSKKLIMIEEEKGKNRSRWKTLDMDLMLAQKLELEDERLKGFDVVILDLSSSETTSSTSSLIKLFLTKYKPSTMILILPFNSDDLSEKGKSEDELPRSWGLESLQNLSASSSSSSYSSTPPIITSSKSSPELSTIVCSFSKNPKSGKRIPSSSLRGRSRRGERRWTSAALLNAVTAEKSQVRGSVDFSLESEKLSSSLGRTSTSNIENFTSSPSRPSLSNPRSLSTPQVPTSICSTNSSWKKSSTITEMGYRGLIGKEKDRTRIVSPCSDLLRGNSRSVSIETRNQEDLNSSNLISDSPSNQNNNEKVLQKGSRERNQQSWNRNDQDESEEEDFRDDDDDDDYSSASSFSDFRGRGNRIDERNGKEENWRSPRSRKQEILPWLSLSHSSLISSPEIVDFKSPGLQNESNLNSPQFNGFRSSSESVERGRDSIVRLPVRLENLNSHERSLAFPHTIIFNKKFNSSLSEDQINSFENDAIFDEVIFRTKEILKIEIIKDESLSSDVVQSESSSNHDEKKAKFLMKSLTEVWKDSELRKVCKGKISSLLDALRLVDPSDEEILSDFSSSKREMGDLIGSDGKTWSLRVIANPLTSSKEESRNLEEELLLVYLSED